MNYPYEHIEEFFQFLLKEKYLAETLSEKEFSRVIYPKYIRDKTKKKTRVKEQILNVKSSICNSTFITSEEYKQALTSWKRAKLLRNHECLHSIRRAIKQRGLGGKGDH